MRWRRQLVSRETSMLVLQIAAGVVLAALVLLALPWLIDQTIRGLPGVAVVLFGSVLVAMLVPDPNSAEATLVIGGAGAVIALVAWWSHKAKMKRSALSERDGEKRGLP
jgi:hypothetical protein